MKSTKFSAVATFLAAVMIAGFQTSSFAAITGFNKCYNGADLPTLIGEKSGSFKTAKIGQKGFLTFGPYVALQPGNYVAVFAYNSSPKANSNIAAVDWTSAGKQIKGTSKGVFPSKTGDNTFTTSLRTRVSLPSVEVRIFDTGQATLQIKYLCIKKIS